MGLKCSGNRCSDLCGIQDDRTTSNIPPHWTHQWDRPTAQAPLEETAVHSDGRWSTVGGARQGNETHRKASSGKQEPRSSYIKCVSQSLSLKFAFRSTNGSFFWKITQYSFSHALIRVPSTLHLKKKQVVMRRFALKWTFSQNVKEIQGSSGVFPKLLWQEMVQMRCPGFLKTLQTKVTRQESTKQQVNRTSSYLK